MWFDNPNREEIIEQKVSFFEPGDVIYAYGGCYKHYGIFVSDEEVIHFNKAGMSGAKIISTDLNEFALGRPVRKVFINDAVYYILNTWQQIKFNPRQDYLYITGDKQQTDEIREILKRYLLYIVPVVFPAQIFQAGKDSINAPFDLIALQVLCV